MERIVGWMKIHATKMGMGLTLRNTCDSRELVVDKIGRGGAVLLREPQNVIFQFGANSLGWEHCPDEWLDGSLCVAYDLHAVNPDKRKYGLVVGDDFRGTIDIEGPVEIHYYCKHSPTDEHVEEMIALARRYIDIDRKISLTDGKHTPIFLVRIVTDTDEVLSESEALSRMVNEAVRPAKVTDLPLLLSGGFSHDEMVTIAALHHTHSMQVPTFYAPKRIDQVSYPTPRTDKRKIYR